MTSAVYRETASAQLSTAGNHYSYISKSGSRAVELLPLPPRQTRAVRSMVGSSTKPWSKASESSLILRKSCISQDVLRRTQWTRSDLVLCEKSGESLWLKRSSLSRYFGNSTHLGLYAKTPTQLGQSQRRTFARAWLRDRASMKL